MSARLLVCDVALTGVEPSRRCCPNMSSLDSALPTLSAENRLSSWTDT